MISRRDFGRLCCAASFAAALPARSAPAQVAKLKITVLSTMLAEPGLGEWGFAALVEAGDPPVVGIDERNRLILDGRPSCRHRTNGKKDACYEQDAQCGADTPKSIQGISFIVCRLSMRQAALGGAADSPRYCTTTFAAPARHRALRRLLSL